MSNSCILMTEKEIEQKFNHMTTKLMKCNVKNEYGPSSDVKSAPNCKKTEEDKRKTKRREKTAFMLN